MSNKAPPKYIFFGSGTTYKRLQVTIAKHIKNWVEFIELKVIVKICEGGTLLVILLFKLKSIV